MLQPPRLRASLTLTGDGLITPINGRAKSALVTLFPLNQFERIGESILLSPEQLEPMCSFLSSLQCQFTQLPPTPSPVTNSLAGTIPTSTNPPIQADNALLSSRPQLQTSSDLDSSSMKSSSATTCLSGLLSSSWTSMSRSKWKSLRSLLTLKPGGETLTLHLP